MAKLRRDRLTVTQRTLHEYYSQGVTKAEFDKLDGLTATTAELNYADGVTSAIQTQIDSVGSTICTDNAVTGTGPSGHAMSSSTYTDIPSITLTITPQAAASRIFHFYQTNLHINTVTAPSYHRTAPMQMNASHGEAKNVRYHLLRANIKAQSQYEDKTELCLSVDHPNGTSAYTYTPQIRTIQDGYPVYAYEGITSPASAQRMAMFEINGASTINWS